MLTYCLVCKKNTENKDAKMIKTKILRLILSLIWIDIMLVVLSQKINKEFKNLCKKEIQIIFTKMNWIKLAFNMIWLMEILKTKKKQKQSDRILKDKAFEINNPKYGGYQRGSASMVYKFFDKKSKGTGIKNEIKQNQQLANELQKPVIRKSKKTKVYSSFKENIWGIDLADMQLISKYDKEIRYLLSAIDLFSKYAFVVPLKDKMELLLLMHFRIF